MPDDQIKPNPNWRSPKDGEVVGAGYELGQGCWLDIWNADLDRAVRYWNRDKDVLEQYRQTFSENLI